MMDESKPSLIDNIKYEITSETTCKVVGYKGWLVKVIIPDEVTIEGKQYRVTVIGKDSFSCSNLTSIELPSGITEIEDQAFMGCTYLESVNLPDGLDAMGDSVFIYCKFIETVEIPDSVKKLGESGLTIKANGIENDDGSKKCVSQNPPSGHFVDPSSEIYVEFK